MENVQIQKAPNNGLLVKAQSPKLTKVSRSISANDKNKIQRKTPLNFPMDTNKLIILCLLFALFQNSGRAQVIFPASEDKPVWTVSPFRFFEPLDNFLLTKVTGDTVINHQKWHRVLETTLDSESQREIGFYRVDTEKKQVYFSPQVDSIEHHAVLLYDFSAQAGDCLDIDLDGGIILNRKVTKVDSQRINGVYRKTLTLQIGIQNSYDDIIYGDQWREGIGSISDPFYLSGVLREGAIGLNTRLLRCFQKNNKIIYSDPDFPFCIEADNQIIYVDDNPGREIQNGTSWSTAFQDLSDALVEAERGDTIWVAEGVYFPSTFNNRLHSFSVRPGVVLLGGFRYGDSKVSDRNPLNRPTILNGDIGEVGNKEDNSFHVVRMETDVETPTVFDGFHVINGTASLSSSLSSTLNKGGGLLIECIDTAGIARPVIRNCFFVENQAAIGGAVYLTPGEGAIIPFFENCTFSKNDAAQQGGALFIDDRANFSEGTVLSIQSCVFDSNTCRLGGAGIYIENQQNLILEIDSCTFSNGESRLLSGGLSINASSSTGISLNISNTVFYNNSGNTGGGFSFADRTSTNMDSLLFEMRLHKTDFVNNNARGEGGGFSWFSNRAITSIVLEDCLFENNYTGNDGGAFYFTEDATGAFKLRSDRVSFIENKSGKGYNGGVYITGDIDAASRGTYRFANCLFVENRTAIGVNSGSRFSSYQGSFVNCTFFENSELPILKTRITLFDSLSGESSMRFYNSIVWEPQTGANPIFYNGNTGNMEDGSYSFQNNLLSPNFNRRSSGLTPDFDTQNWVGKTPLFLAPEDKDFRLASCSFAIDQGRTDFLGERDTLDLLGSPRRLNDDIDLGAFEQEQFQFRLNEKIDVSCAGEKNGSVSFDLAEENGDFYLSWSDTTLINTLAANDLESGDYAFALEDELGCKDTIFTQITQPDSIELVYSLMHPVQEAGGKAGEIQINEIKGGTPPFTLRWEDGSTEYRRANLEAGEYHLGLIDEKGCEEDFTFNLDLVSKVISGQQNIQLEVFPNPLNNQLNLKVEQLVNQEVQVFIFNLSGKQVMNRKAILFESSHSIDVSSLPAGIYVLRLISQERQAIAKIIKQ